MSILKNLFGNKADLPSWEEAIADGSVYPKESISLVSLETKNGTGTGWIDKGYLKYPYKTNCRYNVIIEIDLTDEKDQNNSDLDMATIEDFLIDGLRKVTVAHAISRLITDRAMTMEFYVENKDDTENFLNTASDNPNRLFSINYEMNEDPWWLAVRPLLKMK